MEAQPKDEPEHIDEPDGEVSQLTLRNPRDQEEHLARIMAMWPALEGELITLENDDVAGRIRPARRLAMVKLMALIAYFSI